MLRRVFVTLIVLSLTIASFAPVANASTYLGTAVIDCMSADLTGTGAHILDRDNTGTGEEAIRLEITDGYGAVIFSYSYSNTLQSFSGGIGDLSYNTAPAANPITVRVISLAGNGLPEQVDFVAHGECVGLPYPATPYTATSCTNPQPAAFTVRNIPFASIAYFAADEGSSTGFELPSGNWYVGAAENGFVEVWIACEARNIYVPVSAIN